MQESQDFSLSYRLGYRVSPESCCTAAYEAVQTRNRLDTGVSSTSSRDYFSGVRVGVGVEAEISANVFVRGEYAHSWYGRESTAGASSDLTRGAATLGLGYRF